MPPMRHPQRRGGSKGEQAKGWAYYTCRADPSRCRAKPLSSCCLVFLLFMYNILSDGTIINPPFNVLNILVGRGGPGGLSIR